VICDLGVMLADGGECVSDLGAVREQDALFGEAASLDGGSDGRSDRFDPRDARRGSRGARSRA
jgi:hypothetical protein